MKKAKVIIIGLILIIVLLVIFIFTYCPCGRVFFAPKGLPNGIPIKADGGGGHNFCLTSTPSSSEDSVFLLVRETTGLPINIRVNDFVVSDSIGGYSYWCGIYPYTQPFTDKFVKVDAVDTNDPKANDFHANGILEFARPSSEPSDQNRSLPDVAGNIIFTPNIRGVLSERFYFFVAEEHSPAIDDTLKEEFDTVVTGSITHITNFYLINDKRVLFFHYKPSFTSGYKITLVNGKVDIKVYYME